jgi:hypothetical protein
LVFSTWPPSHTPSRARLVQAAPESRSAPVQDDDLDVKIFLHQNAGL